jgi:rhodanese-related sulfurtransferase
MCKTLFRALLLIGLGVVAGFAHAQLNRKGDNPIVVSLPQQGQQAVQQQETGQPVAVGGQPETGRPEAPESASGDSAGTPVPVVPIQPDPAAAAQAPAADDGYFISVAKAKELYDGKRTGAWDGIFIDARPYSEFLAGHIPGSMHIDKKYFDGAVPAKVRNYLPGMPVVIYCHGENCTDSEAVAVRLIALKRDIGPIHIIKEGLPGWEKAGYPIEKGPEVGFD